MFEVHGFEEEEPVGDLLGIGPGNLPEALDREAFGVDVHHGPAGPQAGNGGDRAQGALPARRLPVVLGDRAQFKAAPEEGIKGRIPGGLFLDLRCAPSVSLKIIVRKKR